MARSQSQIQSQMLDAIAADPDLSPYLTSQSKRAIFRLFTFVIASGIAMLEQLMDIFSSNVETVAAMAAPGTPAWLQDKILKFQYTSVLQFIDFAPKYPVIDETLQIISRCSVTTSLSGKVVIKVATGEPPAPLSGPQISALNAYVNPPNGLGFAGINYSIQSLASDKLYVAANIFYQGQVSNVIQVNVINAINAYLANLPFNGNMKISDLESAIKAVAGVNDVVLIDVRARDNATSLASAIYLVQDSDVLSRQWATVAGYMVSETTGGSTLADSLTFTAE